MLAFARLPRPRARSGPRAPRDLAEDLGKEFSLRLFTFREREREREREIFNFIV